LKQNTRATPLGNRRFGAWLVLDVWESRAGGRYWWCLCDCGVERYVRATELVHGRSRHCGCGTQPIGIPKRRRSVKVEYRQYSHELQRFLAWRYLASMSQKKAEDLIRSNNNLIEYRIQP
jgi:hypothetical protein